MGLQAGELYSLPAARVLPYTRKVFMRPLLKT